MIALFVLSLFSEPSPAPTTLTVDLDGDGSSEIVLATLHDPTIRVDVQSAAGKRLARAEAPAPGSGVPEIALVSGSLGSAGALLEVSASVASRQCRSIWRLRGRDLSPVPIVGPKGALPDCLPSEGWIDRWEKPREDAPAVYVRERTRSTPAGAHHRVEIYRFAGFQLDLDRAQSTAEIAGVPIPDWSPAVLYASPLLEALSSCFDLSPFKTTPRLRFVTDRDQGAFDFLVDGPSGQERLPVTAAVPGKEKREWILTVGSGVRSGRVRVQLASDDRTPLEVKPDGLGAELSRLFAPVNRLAHGGLELLPSAEDMLALQSLPGSWDNSRGERIQVAFVSMAPPVIDFAGQRVVLSIAAAPAGSDVILLPQGGGAPKTALLLRGPDVLARLQVACPSEAGPEACRVSGPGDVFHRVGSSMNVR